MGPSKISVARQRDILAQWLELMTTIVHGVHVLEKLVEVEQISYKVYFIFV